MFLSVKKRHLRMPIRIIATLFLQQLAYSLLSDKIEERLYAYTDAGADEIKFSVCETNVTYDSSDYYVGMASRPWILNGNSRLRFEKHSNSNLHHQVFYDWSEFRVGEIYSIEFTEDCIDVFAFANSQDQLSTVVSHFTLNTDSLEQSIGSMSAYEYSSCCYKEATIDPYSTSFFLLTMQDSTGYVIIDL